MNKVTVFIVSQECDKRDRVIHARNDRLHWIIETNWVYNALQCPLMFCWREDKYHFILKLRNSNTGIETNKKVSALHFYSYRLKVRKDTSFDLFQATVESV